MGFLTSSGGDLLLNKIITSQDQYFLSLVIGTVPGTNSYGDELDEPTGDDYARAAIDNTSGLWVINSGTLYNGTQIDFAEAQTDWGIANGWALTTDPVAGDVIFAGALDDPLKIDTGDTVSIPLGGISFSFVTSSWTGQT